MAVIAALGLVLAWVRSQGSFGYALIVASHSIVAWGLCLVTPIPVARSLATTPSPTLLAMHVLDDRLRSSVRFSLGAFTTEAEVDAAIGKVVEVVRRLGSEGVGF